VTRDSSQINVNPNELSSNQNSKKGVKESRNVEVCPAVQNLRRVNTNGALLDSMTARDQPDNAAHVACDVFNIGCGKPVRYVSADELFIAQADDLKIIVVV
jgi:hypothetical protein